MNVLSEDDADCSKRCTTMEVDEAKTDGHVWKTCWKHSEASRTVLDLDRGTSGFDRALWPGLEHSVCDRTAKTRPGSEQTKKSEKNNRLTGVHVEIGR